MWAVLFTDMVGSTGQRAHLGDVAGDALRREHDAMVADALGAHAGELVKGTGDGAMCAFSGAADALACAVAIQQAIEQRNGTSDEPIGLRIGVSAGDLVCEDGDLHGLAANEAARVCALADAGQILVSELVRAMAGSRAGFPLIERGAFELKGIPDPVAIWEVRWEPLGIAAPQVMPLPGRLRARPWAGVVGREAEMSAILDACKRVAGGEGREVFLISGEAGLGKTTLVAEAARAASDDGTCVLFGHCEEDLATPYQLFAEALGHFVTHATDEQLLAHVEAHGSELARLVPALAARIPDVSPSQATDADTERFLLFAAVVGLLVTASQHQPVVLVLDDLQWADRASLQLFRHLTAAEQTMQVLVLGTYRDSELSRSHPLLDTLAALHRQHGVSHLELDGLDDSGVVSFLEAAAGHALDDAGVGLAHAVYRETDGNPFFVSEVLRHLSETGAIFQDVTGQWTSEATLDQLALPDSVRVVIGARVGRLGPDAERVLSTAAVIGRDFDLDLLARTTTTSEDTVLDILEAAAAASLVRELADAPGHYNFAHALIQHTLYEDLGPTRRARAHRQVGEALEGLCADRPGARVGELARHWFAATQPIDLAKAISYSRQAGDAALSALAPANALSYYTQALDLTGQADDSDPIVALDLAVGLGTAQRLTGDPAFRDTLLDASRRAAALDDTERLVAAALANNRGAESSPGEVDGERVAVLEAALVALGPVETADRARLLATLAVELAYCGDITRISTLADDAVALARCLDDPATLAHALNAHHIALRLPETLTARLDTTREAIALADAAGDPWTRFIALRQRLGTAIETGDGVERRRCATECHAIATRVGQPYLAWVDAQNCATRLLLDGDPEGAEATAEEALAIGTESGEPDAFTIYGVQLLDVRIHQGRTEELVDLVAEAVAESPGLPALRAALARGYLDAGRGDDARALLEASAAVDFADLPRDELWLVGMSMWAHVAVGLGLTGAAALLEDILTPWAGQVPTAVVAVSESVDQCLGELAALLGRAADADVHFAAAEALARRLEAPFYVARALLERARLATATDVGAEAAPGRLAEALDLAEQHGYALLTRQALELQRALG